MAEKFELEFDDSAITAALQRLEGNLEDVDKKMGDIQKSTDKAFEPLKKSAEGVDNAVKSTASSMSEMAVSTEKAGAATEKTSLAMRGYNGALDAIQRQLTAFNSTLGGIVGNLRAKQAAMKGVTTGGTGMVKMFRLLRVAIISTGIGALVLALGALVAYFTQTQKGIDGVNRVMAQMRAVIDTVLERVAWLGSAVVKVFQGDFKGAAEQAKAAVAGIGEEISRVIEVAGILQDRMNALKEAQNAAILSTEELRSEITKLRQVADDESKSNADRVDALEQVLVKSEELFQIQKKLATEAAQIAEEDAKRTETLRERQGEINQLKADVIAIDTEQFMNERRLKTQLQGLRNEEKAAIKAAQDEEAAGLAKLREEYEKLADQLSGQSQTARLNLLDVIDRAIEERELALGAIEKMKSDMLALSASQGFELPPGFLDDINALIKDVEATFEKAVRANRGNISVVEKLVLGDEKTISAEAVNLFAARTEKTIEKGLKDAEEGLTPYLERFRKFVGDSLGLTDEEVQLAFDFIGEAAASITDFTREQTQARIDMYAAEADALRASRDEIRSELETERNEEKMGNANRVSELEARLAAEEAALFAAEGRRLEAERKAANQRLVFDSIQQASKLALAAASVINAEAKNGLLGIILAAGGIALLFSIMAGAKANAAKASQIPKLRHGGELRGRSHEEGGIPMFVDGQLVAEAEDGEFVVNRKTTKRHKGFISELNAGKYDHLDRLTVVDPTRQHRQNIRIVNPTRNHLSGMAQQIRAYETKGVEGSEALVAALMEKAYKAAAKDATSDLINYWKGRPVVRPLEGYIETWEVGNMKQRKVVKQG